jgi:RNA polymerase sigma-70 factor (ECF subfamily)
MGELMFTGIDRFEALDDADQALQMTEETFRVFYDRTARPLWAYLARMTGDDRLADDLLQETYYRFLRARATLDGDDHRRNYLFRIATNLVRDHRRSAAIRGQGHEGTEAADPATEGTAERVAKRIDLARAMGRLTPRERSLLWLAYAQGWSHEEIASSLGLKTGSLKALLFRARRRLAGLIQGAEGSR